MILDGFILAMVGRHLVEPGVNEASRNWHAFVFWTCLDPRCTHRNGVLPHKFVTFTYFWSYFLWYLDVCGESRYGFVILKFLCWALRVDSPHDKAIKKKLTKYRWSHERWVRWVMLGLNIEGYHQYQPSFAIFMEIMNWTLGLSAFSDKAMRRAGRGVSGVSICFKAWAPHVVSGFSGGKNVGNLWKPHYPMGQNGTKLFIIAVQASFSNSFLSTFPQRSSKQTIDLGE